MLYPVLWVLSTFIWSWRLGALLGQLLDRVSEVPTDPFRKVHLSLLPLTLSCMLGKSDLGLRWGSLLTCLTEL